MEPEFLLQGEVLWSYAYEMEEFSVGYKLMAGATSFVGPLHHHRGLIALTATELIMEGAEDEQDFLTIPVNTMSQLYHGYDDVYTAMSVKNAGLFWQPLRITYYSSPSHLQTVYLIVNYNGLSADSKTWYEALTELLA